MCFIFIGSILICKLIAKNKNMEKIPQDNGINNLNNIIDSNLQDVTIRNEVSMSEEEMASIIAKRLSQESANDGKFFVSTCANITERMA